MESRLIENYYIPADVRKQTCPYQELELYSDKIVCHGMSSFTSKTFFFKNYTGVAWSPATIFCQFASIVFLTPENSANGNYVGTNAATTMTDPNRILFCSGMYSYSSANQYAIGVFNEIKEVFEKYQSEGPSQTATIINQASAADEIKKFKNLLDSGIISQEEFEAKKKQLLGL